MRVSTTGSVPVPQSWVAATEHKRNRGHSKRDKASQVQRLGRARPGRRNSCFIALLEKALCCLKALKGMKDREVTHKKYLPVHKFALSVSQKKLDELYSSLRVVSLSMSSSALGAKGAEDLGHKS